MKEKSSIFIKEYQGKQNNRAPFYGADYYSKKELPLLNMMINHLPQRVQIIDNGYLIIFIDEDTSMTFDKDLFDIDYNKEDLNSWTLFYDEMFSQLDINENIIEQHSIFSNIKDDLINALSELPNYQLYLVTLKLRKYLLSSGYVQSQILNNAKYYYQLINKKYLNQRDQELYYPDGELLYIENSLKKQEQLITIEELMLLLDKQKINIKQLKILLNNNTSDSYLIAQNILIQIVKYFFSKTQIDITLNNKNLQENFNLFVDTDEENLPLLTVYVMINQHLQQDLNYNNFEKQVKF